MDLRYLEVAIQDRLALFGDTPGSAHAALELPVPPTIPTAKKPVRHAHHLIGGDRRDRREPWPTHFTSPHADPLVPYRGAISHRGDIDIDKFGHEQGVFTRAEPANFNCHPLT